MTSLASSDSPHSLARLGIRILAGTGIFLSHEKTALATHQQVYELTIMPFGVKNALAATDT